jgi:hypothetical protein
MRTFVNIIFASFSLLALLSASLVSGQEKHSDNDQYQIVAETVMTGFCQKDAEGNTEAVFLDAEKGITLWRNYSPDNADSNASPFMHEHYAEQLSSLTFNFTQNTLDRSTRMLPGVLTFKDMSQDVILDVNMAERAVTTGLKGEIQLIGTLSLRPASPSDTSAETQHDGGLNFCVAMQARTDKAYEAYALEQMMFSTR